MRYGTCPYVPVPVSTRYNLPYSGEMVDIQEKWLIFNHLKSELG
jgi:hypothetical protein